MGSDFDADLSAGFFDDLPGAGVCDRKNPLHPVFVVIVFVHGEMDDDVFDAVHCLGGFTVHVFFIAPAVVRHTINLPADPNIDEIGRAAQNHQDQQEQEHEGLRPADSYPKLRVISEHIGTHHKFYGKQAVQA